MECLVHIGFHKTGTTSFQKLLAENRALLGPGIGLLNHNDAALLPLQAACRAYDGRRSPAAGARIVREMVRALDGLKAAGFDRALISSEMLSGPIPAPHRRGVFYESAPDIAAYLCEGLRAAGCRARFAICTRETRSWAVSLHGHLLRSRGLREPLAAFLARLDAQGFALEEAARAVAARLGRVEIRRMEDDFGTRLGPGTSVLHLAGLDDAALAAWQPVPRQNSGLARETVQTMERPLMLALPAVVRRYVSRAIDRRVKSGKGAHR